MRTAPRTPLYLFVVMWVLVGLYTTLEPSAQARRPTQTVAKLKPWMAGLPHYDVVIDGKKHRLFFTIDDHPGRYTAAYLAELRQHGIKATFFLVAYDLYAYLRSPDYEPLKSRILAIKQAVKDGHVMGNHSITHGLLCKMPAAKVRWEVRGAQQLIKRVLGIEVKYWRPPHGHICRTAQSQAAALHLTTVMWDVDDYRSTPQSMLRVVRRRAKAGDEYTIVLFHNKISKFKTFLHLIDQLRPKLPLRN